MSGVTYMLGVRKQVQKVSLMIGNQGKTGIKVRPEIEWVVCRKRIQGIVMIFLTLLGKVMV
jgi:hypothetical protein